MPLPPDVVFPQGKPYQEWVRGRFYPKVSPGFAHGRLQVRIGARLIAWGEERGFVSSETDTDVTPEADDTRRYLPDVGFWSFERLRAEGQAGRDIPEIPPDLAIEIVSPRDDRAYLGDKVRAYLAAGSAVVLVVDPKTRTIAVHRPSGAASLSGCEAFEDARFPGLRLEPDDLFAILDRC